METSQNSLVSKLFAHPRLLLLGGLMGIMLISSVILFQISQNKGALPPIPTDAVYKEDELIVKFKEGYTPAPVGENERWDTLYKMLQAKGVTGYKPVFADSTGELGRQYILTLKKGTNIVDIRKEIYALDEIESSEPDYILETQATATDPYYAGMWDLRKIDMENAWNVTKGSNNVVAAVVDTGVEYTHADFGGRFGISCEAALGPSRGGGRLL